MKSQKINKKFIKKELKYNEVKQQKYNNKNNHG